MGFRCCDVLIVQHPGICECKSSCKVLLLQNKSRVGTLEVAFPKKDQSSLLIALQVEQRLAEQRLAVIKEDLAKLELEMHRGIHSTDSGRLSDTFQKAYSELHLARKTVASPCLGISCTCFSLSFALQMWIEEEGACGPPLIGGESRERLLAGAV